MLLIVATALMTIFWLVALYHSLSPALAILRARSGK